MSGRNASGDGGVAVPERLQVLHIDPVLKTPWWELCDFRVEIVDLVFDFFKFRMHDVNP